MSGDEEIGRTTGGRTAAARRGGGGGEGFARGKRVRRRSWHDLSSDVRFTRICCGAPSFRNGHCVFLATNN